jgi:hypothetical protein
MPHHMEDLERQIPYSLEKTWSQIPGVCLWGGGGGGDDEVLNWSVHKPDPILFISMVLELRGGGLP